MLGVAVLTMAACSGGESGQTVESEVACSVPPPPIGETPSYGDDAERCEDLVNGRVADLCEGEGVSSVRMTFRVTTPEVADEIYRETRTIECD